MNLTIEDMKRRDLLQYAIDECVNKRHNPFHIAAVITVNGLFQYRIVCRFGHHDLRSIAYKKLTESETEFAPILKNHRVQLRKGKCDRCKKIEILERHHWAPWNTFGVDACTWPTSNLCRACHIEWHKRMNGYIFNRSYSNASD